MDSSNDRFEVWLSWLLRGGTWLALGLIAIGILADVVNGRSWIGETELGLLLSGATSLRAEPPANVAEFAYGFRSFDGLKFVQAALMVLILLPALRVAFLLGNFVRQRDWTFVILSGMVLVALSAGYVLRVTH